MCYVVSEKGCTYDGKRPKSQDAQRHKKKGLIRQSLLRRNKSFSGEIYGGGGTLKSGFIKETSTVQWTM